MADNTVSVDVELMTAKAVQQLEQLNGRFSKFGTVAEKALESLDKRLGISSIALGNFIGQVAYKAVAAMGQFAASIVRDGIASANSYEDALTGLNTALALNGNYTAQASKELEAFASEIQRTTRYGDEMVLSAASLIENMARLGDKELKNATQAAVELSAALKIDLDSAAKQIAGTFEGTVSKDLKKAGFELDGVGTKAEQAARLLDQVNQRFGGSAAANANTFAGALDKLSHNYEDFTKQLMFTVTQNPIVIKAISEASRFFSDLASQVEANKVGLSKFVGEGVLALVTGLGWVLKVGDGTLRFFMALGQSVMLAADVIVSAFVGVMAGVANSVNSTLGAVLRVLGVDLGEQIQQTTDAINSSVGSSIDGIEQRVLKMSETFSEQGAMGKIGDFVLNAGEKLKDQEIKNAEEVADKKRGIREDEKKAIKEMDEWEKAIRKGNLAFTGKVLENMATLMQTNNRELFYIGKASALANATINTAQGVSKAIGEYSYPYNLIAAAAVAVAGGVQIATIAGTNPSFAQGGIVPGNSMTGDRVQANVNSREAVLNLEQQQNLFNAINENRLGGGAGTVINISGNVIADTPERIQELAERISYEVRYRNATLYASDMA